MQNKKITWKRLSALLLSLLMVCSLMATAAFATDGSATITINKPTAIDTDWKDMTVKAYMVLDQVNPAEGTANKKQYDVTDDFVNFFNIEAATATIFCGAPDSADKAYLSYDAGQNEIMYSATEGAIAVSNAKLDVTYPEADLVSRLTKDDTNTKTAATFYTWLEKYIEGKEPALTADKTGTATSDSPLKLNGLNEGYYALIFSEVPDKISVKQGILVATSDMVTLKAEQIPLTKQVKPVDKTTYAESATAELGEALEYKITSRVPTLTDYSNLTKFEFEDTLEQQLVDVDTMSLVIEDVQDPIVPDKNNNFKIGEVTIANLNVEDYGWDAEIEKNAQTFTLTFVPSALASYQGKEITLTYQAALTADAVAVNGNTVTLNFDNNDDTSELTAETEVYTYGIKVDKDFSDQRTTDTAVTFELRRGTVDGVFPDEDAAIAMVGDDGVYHIPGAGETAASTVTALNLDDAGMLTITGLDEDNIYWLVETATNTEDGFTVADPIQIVLKADENDKSKLDADGSTAYYYTDEQLVDTKDLLKTLTAGTGAISLGQLTVLNQKGFNLPQTGGMGIWMFTIGGILMIAAAGGLFALSRKKEK